MFGEIKIQIVKKDNIIVGAIIPFLNEDNVVYDFIHCSKEDSVAYIDAKEVLSDFLNNKIGNLIFEKVLEDDLYDLIDTELLEEGINNALDIGKYNACLVAI